MYDTHPVVKIAGLVAGATIPIVLVIAIFSSDQLWVAAPIVGLLALMAVILSMIVTRRGPKEMPQEPTDEAAD